MTSPVAASARGADRTLRWFGFRSSVLAVCGVLGLRSDATALKAVDASPKNRPVRRGMVLEREPLRVDFYQEKVAAGESQGLGPQSRVRLSAVCRSAARSCPRKLTGVSGLAPLRCCCGLRIWDARLVFTE